MSGEAGHGLLAGETVPLHDPFHLLVGPADDDGRPVHAVVVPRLEEEGDHQDDDSLRVRLAGARDGLGHTLEDAGVDDLLEVAPGRAVVEDEPGQGRPVERPVGLDDLVAEAHADFLKGRPAGGDDLARGFVGVDDGSAEGPELLRHEALPRGDPPCEAYDEH